MMNGVDVYDRNDKAGKYRKDMTKAGGHWTGSKPEDIEEHLCSSLENYKSMLSKNIHPINYMAFFHSKFEQIHPFKDGNGRTGRAIFDYMLKMHDFPSMYIRPSEREEYINALKEGNHENYTALVDLLIQRMLATFTYIAAKSTTMYYGILSNEYRSWFINELRDEDVYKTMVVSLKHIRTTDDDP